MIDATALDALEPSAGSRLLHHALADQRPPSSRRVFVNRTLRMDKIRYVGFDLDWTLADYDQDSMAKLAFELTLTCLVEHFDYPRQILQAEFRAEFLRRGQLIDTRAGTVVKMSRHRYVGRAFHGRTFLPPEERAELYRREPVNPASERFYFVDTLFELPEVNVFSELVELKKTLGDALPSYRRIFEDGRKAIDGIHADGSLKSHILADLPRYLPLDPQLSLALERLSMGGRRLILITNSEPYYTDALCKHLFEGAVPGVENWRQIFDLVVFLAGKPTFFKKPLPFREVGADGQAGAEVERPEWGKSYIGGSRAALMDLLDCPGEEVLYVGDHIYGDILSSKLTSTWRTAMVVRELEDELAIQQGLVSQLRHLDVLRAESTELGHQVDDLRDVLSLYRLHANDQPEASQVAAQTETYLGGLAAEHKALRKHVKRLQERISKALNPYWGSVFKQGSNKSFFGSQVDDFACLYTSRVSNFAFYGSHHYYRVLRDPMMHDLER